MPSCTHDLVKVVCIDIIVLQALCMCMCIVGQCAVLQQQGVQAPAEQLPATDPMSSKPWRGIFPPSCLHMGPALFCHLIRASHFIVRQSIGLRPSCAHYLFKVVLSAIVSCRHFACACAS